jgi:hypothetical protein
LIWIFRGVQILDEDSRKCEKFKSRSEAVLFCERDSLAASMAFALRGGCAVLIGSPANQSNRRVLIKSSSFRQKLKGHPFRVAF